MTVDAPALYFQTEQAWEAMLAVLREAKENIDFEQYLFEDVHEGGIGRKFVDVFLERAQRGVQVRLLVDSLGSINFLRTGVVRELVDAGIKVEWNTFANPLNRVDAMLHFFRNHRKLMVVDRAYAFVGGVVVTERARHWRDTHLYVTGKPAEVLGLAFDRHWEGFTVGKQRQSTVYPVNGTFRVVANAPGVLRRHIRKDMLQACKHAVRTIEITSPYLAPDRALARALFRAVRRGVSVRVLIPQVSDLGLTDLASLSSFAYFLRHGVRVFQYLPTMVHAKIMVVDDVWATIGSTNLDPLSLHFNHELNIHTTDPGLICSLREQFLRDCGMAHEVTRTEWEQRTRFQRLKYDVVGALLSYII